MSVTTGIEKQMADLYTMFCMPRIVLNTETGKVDITYVWTSDEARQIFEKLQEVLVQHFVEERQRQAVEHTLAVDWAKAGEDRTVVAKIENGQIVDVRVIPPRR